MTSYISYAISKSDPGAVVTPNEPYRYQKVTKRFMAQLSEISDLETAYDVVLLNPSVIKRERKARECLEFAKDFDLVGATEKALTYYIRAILLQNELVLEAYKTVALQYLIETYDRIDRQNTRKDLEHFIQMRQDARRSYQRAESIRETQPVQSKQNYRHSIQISYAVFSALA